MGIAVLVGGQFGSEGKGKIAAYLAPEFQMAIRTGGPNAGHTVEYEGNVYKLQSIPCTFVNPNCLLAIGAGGIIDISILMREVSACSVDQTRLVIDPQTGIIDEDHVKAEVEIRESIGSTSKGVGAALAAKIRRANNFRLARDVAELQTYLGDVAALANVTLDTGGKVLLEGTQGFGLSLHHGSYPFVTSRDTTAGTLCGDAGVSPLLVKDIIMVIRTYPIRVAGNSGPLRNEIDWQAVTQMSGSSSDLVERTTVTNKVRRVARFDLDLVKRAVLINRPTQMAINFIDYIDSADAGKRSIHDLSSQATEFIQMIEAETGVHVTLIGTGPRNEDIIDLRS